MNRITPLVSTKWLADTLRSKYSSSIRILDASYHLKTTGRNAKREFLNAHVPGALFFDIDECADKKATCSHMLPNPSEFESYVGNLGITNDTHVVIFDNNETFGMFSAPRAWWTFRIFGHGKVSILDGGLPKWCSEGRLTSREIVTVPNVKFHANFSPHLVKSFEDIRKNINKKDFQLVDARASDRFYGTTPKPKPAGKLGRIPGSVNIPFTSILDPDTKIVKTDAELRKIFAMANVNLDQPIAVSCGSGVTACCIALAAYKCGKEDVAVYDGSWTEWSQRSLPDERLNCPEN